MALLQMFASSSVDNDFHSDFGDVRGAAGAWRSAVNKGRHCKSLRMISFCSFTDPYCSFNSSIGQCGTKWIA